MKKVFLLILVMWVYHYTPLSAQSFNMANTSITTCGGTFYDNGGQSGNYSNNQFLQFTVCSGQPLNQIQVSFSSFNLENGNDFLHIYNGSNTSAPLLGIFTGTVNPGMFTSANGCLTFIFIANSSVNATGWTATFSCLSTAPPPCSVTGCPAGGSAPLNDACANATNLGALPSPANCPNGTGNTFGVAGTTSCANPENPFLQQQGCLSGNNMPAPAADVWYTFTLTGSELNVQIQGMNNPSAALWQGNNCIALIGRGCATGNAGSLNATFQALSPGQYYLQISGGNPTDQCNFTLLLKNNRDCNACNVTSTIVATPPPVNGTYAPGQTVTFCYTVSSFNQTSANWLHGVVPVFGPGWNMASLTNLQPANSCSGSGTWAWYNTPITGSATGTTAGPGFFYETWQGNNLGVADNNPGNNYGDNNASNCIWTFCWTIQTKSGTNCIQGGDLTIDVNSYGDGETGSWSSLACTTDPPTTSIASLQCCSIPTVTATSPNCSGGPASGTATGTGQGTGPWTYSWYINNILFQTTPNHIGPSSINGLIPGNYTFTTTDANGCSASSYFTITSPSSLNVNIAKTNTSCSINNGTATTSVSGGTGPYTYLWSNGATTASINNLGPGIVTVTATDSNGCSAIASTNITQPTGPVLNISSSNVNCSGGSNGSALVNAVGGTAPYSYQWSNSGTSASINNLIAGNYSVTVTDANGCLVTATTTITQPSAGITASITVLSLAACNNANGSATVSASGGIAPYYYSWSNGANTSTATGLSAGNISVTVTDLVGCNTTVSDQIAMALPPVAQIISQSDPTCFGGNNGNATVNVSGGAAPYTYNWSSGSTNPTATNLIAGNYSVTITDATGCTSTASLILSEPAALNVSPVNQNNVSCFGGNNGTASVIASGGTGQYNYFWSSGAATAMATGLSNNLYYVTVTDANGCTSSSSVSISQPDSLAVSVSVNDVSCFAGNDGSAVVNVSGGTGSYQYNWSSGSTLQIANNLIAGNYSVVITDANNCTVNSAVLISQPSELIVSISTTPSNCTANDGTATAIVSGGSGNYSYLWNSGGNTATSTNLPSGQITLTVTDGNGCVANETANVLTNTTLTSITQTTTNISCAGINDGSISVSADGGTSPFDYTWYPNISSGNTASSLYAGNYAVTITDANGCTVFQNITLTEPLPLTVSASTSASTCGNNNGSALINVSGGTGNYNYNWSSGSNSAFTNNLSAGFYAVTITDANGCTAFVPIVINEIEGPTLAISTLTNISCNGAQDGEVTLIANGGTGNITYTWIPNFSTTNTGINLPDGNYSVIATDINGCSTTQQFSITEPDALSLNIISTDALCNNSNDGTATVIADGGSGNYSYNWSTGISSSSINNLIPGTYFVTVSDQNGCSQTSSVYISSPLPISLTTSADTIICSGQSTIISASASGGTGTLNYLWSNGSNSAINNVTPGVPTNYSVIVTDDHGCQSSAAFVQVDFYPALNATIGNVSVICPGEYVDLNVTAVGGTGGPYTYQWSSGQTGSAINTAPLTSSTYSVIVTDGCGSTVSTTVNVPVESLPVVSFMPDKTEGCGSLLVNLFNNSQVLPGSVFHWDFGDNTTSVDFEPIKNYPNEGTYDITLVVISPSGCISSATIPEAVKIYPVPESAFTYSPKGEVSMLNAKISFLDLSHGADVWSWNFGDGKGISSTPSPQYTYPAFGTYLVTLVVSNNQGCSDTSYQKVIVEENFAVYFPNSFTPDDNGMNDYFYAFGEGIQTFEMRIYDRWGKMVFSSDHQQIPWNGKFLNNGNECPLGVYVYSVIVSDPAGKIHSFKGTVNLIR